MMPAEQRVADYILAYPDETVHLSIADLSLRAGVSEGTIVRFCQTVGYKGYQSLKISLAADVALSTKIIHGEAEPSDAPVTLAQKVILSDVNALYDTLRILDPQDLERACQALLDANHVEFFASGTSFPIALDAYIRFLRIGLPVAAYADSHVQAMRAVLLGPGDVAFAISHSGQSREPVHCLRLARERGATTIAITGSKHSAIAETADILLIAASSETLYREEAMASRIAQLCLVDTLYVGVALQRFDASLANIKATGEALVDHRC
jgi:DNA-binding MurR/RpiR family transcriptional regulator